MKRTLILATVLGIANLAASATPILLATVPVSPNGTFLEQSSSDNCSFVNAAPGCTAGSFTPTVVNLGTLGITPGETLELIPQGSFCFYPGPGCTLEPPYLGGVFDTNNTLLPSTYQDRLPGAIQTSLSSVTDPGTLTYYGALNTFIPQDFYISTGSFEVVVPANANYLFIGVLDSFYADNTGNLSVELLSLDGNNQNPGVPEPASYWMVCAGIAALAGVAGLRRKFQR